MFYHEHQPGLLAEACISSVNIHGRWVVYVERDPRFSSPTSQLERLYFALCDVSFTDACVCRSSWFVCRSKLLFKWGGYMEKGGGGS